MESSYGQQGKNYVKWAAKMALGLGAGVPWVMCKQTDAPENIVKPDLDYLCLNFFHVVFVNIKLHCRKYKNNVKRS